MNLILKIFYISALWNYFNNFNFYDNNAAQKLKFSSKNFFSKSGQIRSFPDLVTFTEEILTGKLHFLYSVTF